MKEFKKVDENDKLEIVVENINWKKKLSENIKDDDLKLCFEILAPCIGYSKASVNYKIIQRYINNKIKKGDEMSEIYSYIYSCLFGKKELNDSSVEKYYKLASNKESKLLQNIIKYTFYYDQKRKGKTYYYTFLNNFP